MNAYCEAARDRPAQVVDERASEKYTFEASMRLKPGDTVRVVGERGTSKIRAILTAVNGALLEQQIGGYRNWNLDDLRLVKRVNGLNRKSEEIGAKLKAHYWHKKKNPAR